MSDLDQAAQALGAAAAALGRVAAKYGAARKHQDDRHEKTVDAHDDWLEETPPSEKVNKRLRECLAKENAAIHDTNVAEDALRDAIAAFNAALQAFQAAALAATSH